MPLFPTGHSQALNVAPVCLAKPETSWRQLGGRPGLLSLPAFHPWGGNCCLGAAARGQGSLPVTLTKMWSSGKSRGSTSHCQKDWEQKCLFSSPVSSANMWGDGFDHYFQNKDEGQAY